MVFARLRLAARNLRADRVACVLTVVLAAAAPAAAHRLAPALLAIEEAADGKLDVVFKTPLERESPVELVPQLPEGCAATTPRRAASTQPASRCTGAPSATTLGSSAR